MSEIDRSAEYGEPTDSELAPGRPHGAPAGAAAHRTGSDDVREAGRTPRAVLAEERAV